ncbi:MAG: nicotinate (nicotinamide) nucleotide adenylyltransferase [Desulfovibrionaceae bacterium]|nr:nicotinate (nicotinamide) nucleotide adenylyltransferase [Desulfovibrionaceae bacterium]
MRRAIGILGGSFNPVHLGHVRAAIEVRERLGLDRVDLVPAGVQPMKPDRNMLPFEFRRALLEAAVHGAPGLAVNPLEGLRPGPSFTCDTLDWYRAAHPDLEPYFILGAPSLLDLPAWKRGPDLPGLAHFVALARAGTGVPDIEALLARHWPGAARLSDGRAEAAWRLASGRTLFYLDIPRMDVSSTLVRDRWRAKKSLFMLLPPGVERGLMAAEEVCAAAWGPRG